MMCRLGLLKAGPPPVVLEIISAVADNTGDTTSHTFSIPTGLVAGNLLVSIFGQSNGGSAIVWPGDWIEVASHIGATLSASVAYKFATGSEGSTITVSTSGGPGRGVQRTFRILGAHASAPPEVIVDTPVVTANPNPPSLSPTWGLLTNYALWIAFANKLSGTANTAYPSSYTLFQDFQSNGDTTGGLASAARQNMVATENPGTFSYSASHESIAGTIAIRPV